MPTSAQDTAQIRGDAAPSGARRPASPTVILILACLAQFMVILDVSIVNVALPAMREHLGMSATGQQWIVNAYTLGFAGLLLLGGRAADIVGTRRVFLIGLAAFTVASLAGGLATDGSLLIAARAVQGIGGAVLAPATLTLIVTTFTEPAARTKAMGMWSAVMASGGAVGAVLGGVLTQYAGWRWVLFVNVPVGVVLFAIALGSVTGTPRRDTSLRGLDLPGAVAVSAGLTALVYGIISTETHSFSDPQVWAALAAGVVLLGAFVAIELRAPQPLVPLAVLRRRTLATTNVLMLMMSAAMFAMWFLLSLYLQQVLGYSAVTAGLCFVPGGLAIIVGAQVTTRLLRKFSPRPLLAVGLFLSTIGFVWLSRFTATGNYGSDVVMPYIVTTFGMGLAVTPATVAATTGVEPALSGLASGLINTSRQVGGAIGLAVLATIASHTTASRIGHMSTGAALTSGYGRALLVSAAFTAAAAVAALLLPAKKRVEQPVR